MLSRRKFVSVIAAATTVPLVGLPSTGFAAEVAVEKVLDHQYQVQATSYWCSAAAARIALSARGRIVGQRELANYMAVNPQVGLPNIKNLERALDHYTGGTYYQVKQWPNDGALRQKLRADVLYNVDRGHAVVINVVRIANASFPGGHYATIVGYRGNGAEYAIADPASSLRRFIWLSAENVASGIKLRRYVA